MNLIQKRNLRLTILALVLMALMSWCGVRNHPDNVNHPDNQSYVAEVAFNLEITPEDVTQDQFNARYGTTLRTIKLKK